VGASRAGSSGESREIDNLDISSNQVSGRETE